jgi:subtilase family serine protease
VRLPHTRASLPREATALGRVESGRALQRMVLVLSPSGDQEQQLKTLLDEQQNPNSPNYHHWLTSAEFGRRFGANTADLQTICEWLDRAGFNVSGISAGKRWVEFSGTAAQVESAFHTEMHYFQWHGKTYLANSTDLGLPVELSGITRGIVSLNNFHRQPPIRESRGSAGRDVKGRETLLTPNLTASGATNTYYVAPGDFAAIYNTDGLLSSGIDGTGVSIAVTAQSQIELTDVQAFRQIFGLKTNDPNILVSGPDPGIINVRDTEEAQLDVEWAGAVAPGATINLVIAGSTDTTSGVDLAAAYAIDNEIAPILTYTYGSCEQALGPTGNAFYNGLWQQAAAEGITVLVAAGDNGAAGCDNPYDSQPTIQGMAVNGVASTPYNLAVGGTEFAEGAQPSTYWSATNNSNFASAFGYIPEAAWNGSCDPAQPATDTNCAFGNTNFSSLAGGGGASTVYTKPAWQVGTGVPADNARDVPDIALAAASGHDDFVYCTSVAGVPCQVNNQQVFGLTLVGGTSVPTPAMAGILALVEQKNGAFQGQVNYGLYKLAQTASNVCNSSNQTNPTAQNSCVFYDVTSGSNAVPCAGGSPNCSSTQSGVNGFLTGNAADPGYDLATGLGSVNATNLANAWKNISLAQSQTTLQASNTSFAHGTAVTVNGTVAPASGNGMPTGAVSIKTDQYGDSKQALSLTNGGTFSGTVSDLPGGQYNLYAHYAGDASYAASNSSVVPVTVTPESSVTSLVLQGSPSSVSYGAPVQLQVTIAGTSGQGIATGSVTIQDGLNIVGTYGLAADGTASIRTGAGSGYAFTPGTHTLTAAYSGDHSFNASTSSAVQFTVTKGTPFVIVGVNASSIPLGETLGVHAVVSGSGIIAATGTVQFTVDGAVYGSPVALQNGGFFGTQAQASILISNLTQGTHVIGASYDGSADPNYNSVASGDAQNELTQTVSVGTNSGTKSTTTLTVQPAPVNLGDPGTFTVSVAPTIATGTVTVWDAVGPRSAATIITSGTATIQFPWTQAGTALVYAVYSGDSTFAGSASTPTVFTVNKGVPQVTLTAPANTLSTQQFTLNVNVAANPAARQLPYPTGAIEIWDSLNGGSAQMLMMQNLTAGAGGLAVYATRMKMSPGTHSIYAHYRGDTNWQAANSQPVPLTSANYTLSVSPNPMIVTAGTTGSGTVTITPSGGFTGAVSLTCGTGGTIIPAGYSCTFGQANVSVAGGTTNTSLNLTVASTAASVVKTASASPAANGHALWGFGFASAFLLLCLSGMAAGAATGRDSRNFFLACGFVLAVASAVVGCGGGGGGGGAGGPVSTTTTIVSSNLHVGFGTPVTFTVTVTPQGNATPSGLVQLYDNGQAFGAATSVGAGIASFLATNLPVGIHNFTAKYGGDANTRASTSGTIAQGITGTIGLQITGASNGLTQTADFQVVVN